MAKDEVSSEIMSEAPAPKKQKLIEDPSEKFEEQLNQINDLEEEINKIEDEQSMEICKLEQKYVQKKEPVFEKRDNIIEGIEKFWYRAIVNHPQLSCMIAESDLDCLENHLVSIKLDQKLRDVEVQENGQTFMKSLNQAITFVFSENEWFENTEITKSFYQYMDDVISESTEIKWKEGKNLIEICREKMAKATKNGNSAPGASGEQANEDVNEEDTEDDMPDVDSFFGWFEDHEQAGDDEVCDIIKDDLYIHACNYFLAPIEDDEDGEEEVDLEETSEE